MICFHIWSDDNFWCPKQKITYTHLNTLEQQTDTQNERMNERAGKPKINNDTRPSTKREVETQAFQERIVIPSYESSLDI